MKIHKLHKNVFNNIEKSYYKVIVNDKILCSKEKTSIE